MTTAHQFTDILSELLIIVPTSMTIHIITDNPPITFIPSHAGGISTLLLVFSAVKRVKTLKAEITEINNNSHAIFVTRYKLFCKNLIDEPRSFS
jgi:hypothetical protein